MALEPDDSNTSGLIKGNASELPATPRSAQGRVSISGRPPRHLTALEQSAARMASGVVGSQSQSLDSLEKSNVQQSHIIEKYEDPKDARRIKNWRSLLHKLLPITTLASFVAYGIYFVFRIICTVHSQRAGQTVYPLAWTIIAIELGVIFPIYFFQILLCFSVLAGHRPRLRIVGDYIPRVDVLITCAGEEIDVILDTVKAANGVDWPHTSLRVIVLDDKNSEEVRREVQLLALKNISIHYTARHKVPGVPSHFKAGNLNHGLEYLKSIGGQKAEYIAPLDADMIVERQWLRAILPHLLIDPAMAIACPPQVFYNVPKNDTLYQNMAFFFNTVECAKDAIGSAWCTGSGYVIRRSALDQIGDFPVESVAEDVLCSSMLIAAGWKTCYLNEVLQCGRVPDSFFGHLKQRTRWTIRTLQTSARLNFFLFGRECGEMTLLQRFCGFTFAVTTHFAIPSAFSLILFPIVLVSGSKIIGYANAYQLRWLIRLAFLASSTSRLNEWIGYLKTGYHFAWRGALAGLWMAPYHAVAIIRFFVLPHWLGGKSASFSSSGSIKSMINERDIHARASLPRRLKFLYWNGGVIIHVVYVLFTLGAVALSIARTLLGSSGSESRLVYMLTHAGWPPMYWLSAVIACWSPIVYAIRPPAMPDREDLVQREKDSGIARPREDAEHMRWGMSHYLLEFFYAAITIYMTVLFIGSWLL